MAICTVCSSFLEAAAVGSRIDVEAALERAAHGLDGPEAAGAGHGVDRGAALLEFGAGAVETHGLDVRGRRHPDLAPECAGEVPRAHECALCKRRHREVAVQVL